jgi:hypothetical protein
VAELPPLPAGFTLDTPQASADLPPLPEGFTLDTAPAPEPVAESAPQETRTPLQEAGRQVGLAGRSLVNAAAGIPLMVMDAGVAARNLASNLSRGEMPTLADFNPFAKEGGSTQEYELPSRTFEKQITAAGLPEPQTVGEKVAGFVQTMVAGSRIPAPQAARQAPKGFTPADPASAVRASTLREAQQAGYVVPPATTNPTTLNRALEGASGKIATAQQAAVRNQAVTNKLARQALGMANDAPITPESLKTLRATAGEVYKRVGSAGEIVPDSQYLDELTTLGKGADDILKDFPDANVGAAKEIEKLVDSLLKDKFDSKSALAYLRELRNQAKGNLSPLAAADPSKQALGMAQREAASVLEDLIGRHLAATGAPEVAQSFQQARKLIAISHTVENALNEATGNVAATKLGQQMAKGKPLSGELATAAKFARAFPKAAKEVTESMPGISPLDYYGSIGAAGLFQNPTLLLLPAIRMGIREALLSPYGQKAAVEGAKAAGSPAANIGLTGGAAVATSSELRQ